MASKLASIKVSRKTTRINVLAHSLNITTNQLYRYLREKGFMDYFNQPESGFEDWFEGVLHHDYSIRRHDLTPKGLKGVQIYVKRDGIQRIINRPINGPNRKGDKHGKPGYVTKRKR